MVPTNIDDAHVEIECGADALGFVYCEQSERFIPPQMASVITEKLPPFITTVGVFVNETRERINSIADVVGLDVVQLHGDETPGDCEGINRRVVKAVRVREAGDLEGLDEYPVRSYLLDAYSDCARGGTGETFNWDLALEAKRFGHIILAGGLNPDNIEEAIKKVTPACVDVSSGVELHPGKKDPEKVRQFIEKVRGIEYGPDTDKG